MKYTNDNIKKLLIKAKEAEKNVSIFLGTVAGIFRQSMHKGIEIDEARVKKLINNAILNFKEYRNILSALYAHFYYEK